MITGIHHADRADYSPTLCAVIGLRFDKRQWVNKIAPFPAESLQVQQTVGGADGFASIATNLNAEA